MFERSRPDQISDMRVSSTGVKFLLLGYATVFIAAASCSQFQSLCIFIEGLLELQSSNSEADQSVIVAPQKVVVVFNQVATEEGRGQVGVRMLSRYRCTFNLDVCLNSKRTHI